MLDASAMLVIVELHVINKNVLQVLILWMVMEMKQAEIAQVVACVTTKKELVDVFLVFTEQDASIRPQYIKCCKFSILTLALPIVIFWE